jgi:uncharacterized oxidoreductase
LSGLSCYDGFGPRLCHAYDTPAHHTSVQRVAMIVTDFSLRQLVTAILEGAGSPANDAQMVADHLVDANLLGHDSHGVQLVRRYVEHIQAATCKPGTSAVCVNDAGAILQFDGGRGFGIRVGTEAMHAAMARCKTTGVVLMTLRNAHHIGRVGAYADLALAEGLVSIHFVNVVDHAPMVAPFGGREARFGTNPICIGIPGTKTTPPFLLDMATSAVALGKVVVARQSGKSVPENALINAQGKPTTDPAEYFGPPQGALLPFGLHKGYGLMLACEILAGALSGYGTIQPETPRLGAIVNNMFSFVIDPARLGNPEAINHELDHLMAYLKATPTVGEQPVAIAGEPEAQTRVQRAANGIDLPAGTLSELENATILAGIGKNTLKMLSTPINHS